MYEKEDIFLITGGSSGIGAACALELNAQGAHVIALGRNKCKLDNIKGKASNKIRFTAVSFDLSRSMQDTEELIKDLVDKYGRIRGCIVSSGVQNIQPVSSISEESAMDMIRINYLSSLLLQTI